jgi:hypothetical protein
LDPFLLTIATAIAGKAADAVVEGGQNACGALVRVVRERFSRDKAAAEVLETASRNPKDDRAIADLAEMLQQLLRVDTDFETRLRSLWPAAEAELSASESGVVNSATGTVSGHLMQARDVRIESGGIHFGDVH